MFSSQRVQRGWRHATIALATTAGDSWHSRTEVVLRDHPFWVSSGFPNHLAHLKRNWAGDWHSHPYPGSTTPSKTDAVGWVKGMDRIALARYVGIIVSPSESQGWLFPVFSAWTVRREGVSLLPICERARLSW